MTKTAPAIGDEARQEAAALLEACGDDDALLEKVMTGQRARMILTAFVSATDLRVRVLARVQP